MKSEEGTWNKMTDKNEMPLKNCPFCGGDCYTNSTWNRNEGFRSYGVNCARCLADMRGFDTKKGAIVFWNTRAAQPQPPVIEGLDEAIEAQFLCSDRVKLDILKKAAKLYAQGQTAQPVHSTQGTDFHRCNVETTEKGFRLCDGLHDKNEPCEWVLYEPKAQPVDLDAIPVAWGVFNRECLVTCFKKRADADEYLREWRMNGKDHYEVRLLYSAPFKHRVITQSTEDAQRALDQMHLIVFDGCDDADKVMETIRAALARGLGE